MSSLHGASTTSKCTATESPKTNSTEIIVDQTTITADIVQHTAHLGQTNLFHSSKHFGLVI